MNRSLLPAPLLSVQRPAPDCCLFWFDGPKPYVTSVAAIYRQDCCLVLDSFCGSAYMDWVRAELNRLFSPQRFLLVNSHFHWDHCWGNISFADSPIYSTALCRRRIQEQWEQQLKENASHFCGEQTLCLPTHLITETTELLPQLFAFPSPGHSNDCLSLWDAANGFLFVGDCVERPLVQLCDDNLLKYKNSINQFLSLSARAVFSGHCMDCDPSILLETQQYLAALDNNLPLKFSNPIAQQTHEENRLLLAKSKENRTLSTSLS